MALPVREHALLHRDRRRKGPLPRPQEGHEGGMSPSHGPVDGRVVDQQTLCEPVGSRVPPGVDGPQGQLA